MTQLGKTVWVLLSMSLSRFFMSAGNEEYHMGTGHFLPLLHFYNFISRIRQHMISRWWDPVVSNSVPWPSFVCKCCSGVTCWILRHTPATSFWRSGGFLFCSSSSSSVLLSCWSVSGVFMHVWSFCVCFFTWWDKVMSESDCPPCFDPRRGQYLALLSCEKF